MHDMPLNDTQRIFADKNHNLVYKFLHEKNLPASEYYDIVISGYLRAVQRYLSEPNLAGYSFATVAWRAMEGEVVNTHRTDKRRFRVIRFVRPRQSYTGHLTRRSTPTVTDEEALRESEVALLLHALAKRVTPQQMEIIRLRTKGYQTNEIAQMQNTSLYHVNTLLDNARFIVVELCRDTLPMVMLFFIASLVPSPIAFTMLLRATVKTATIICVIKFAFCCFSFSSFIYC